MGKMRKIYALKQWYTLNQAKERLSLTLGEPISEKEILSLAAEGHLELYCFFNYQLARLASPATLIYDFSKLKKSFPNPRTPENAINQSGKSMWSGYEYGKETEHLYDAHKLCLDICPPLKDWVASLITDREVALVGIEGYLVSNEIGELYQILDTLSSASEGENRQSYFPSDNYPNYEDLGMTKSAIERFEKLASGEISAKSDTLTSKSFNSIMIIVLAMAVKKYHYKPAAQKNSATANIKGAAEELGLNIGEDTVRKWLKKAADTLDGEYELPNPK